MKKIWTARFNAKKSNATESNYTFTNHKDKTKTKHDFTYRRENQFVSKLNSRCVDVYKNDRLQEVALVETFNLENTSSEPKFLTLKEWLKFTQNWQSNSASELAQTLDRFFDCNFLNNN